MKKSCLIALLMTIAATVLTAEVMTFANFEKNGVPVLIPAVQKYESREGIFHLPNTLTVALPAGEELVLEQLAQELRRFGKTAAAAENAQCRFVLAEDGVPEQSEGYLLTVDSDGITVKSRTTAGLYYGAQTLRNMLCNAAAPELKACTVADWPDFVRRGYFFSMAGRSGQSMPLLKKMLDTISRLKVNWIMIDFGQSFPFEDNPLTLRNKALTREEARQILQWCRERHIELTPTIQVWSHAQWMTYHPDWNKMKEGEPSRRWLSQPCPECAEAYELIRKSVNEHIDLFQPRAIFMMMDEFYLGPFNKCPKCKGKNTFEQFAKIVKFGEDLCFARGVTPLVCHDSFRNYDFLGWTFGEKLLERLDPKTQIVYWNYNDDITAAEMKPFKRHKLIGHSVNGKPLNVINTARCIKENGGDESTMVYWYYSAGGMIPDIKGETPESLGGFVIGADALWKFDDNYYGKYGYDAVTEMMRLLQPEQVKVRPGMAAATPLPLDDAVNAELSATRGKFPRFASDEQTAELKQALRALPERFELLTAPGGKYYAVRVTGDKKNGGRHGVMLKIGNVKIKDLSFLLTASRPDDGLAYAGARFYGAKRFAHPVVGAIDFHYADGTKSRTYLRYRESVTDWNRPFGGSDMRFAVRGTDADGKYYSFGIFDLANPHPEKPVKGILFSSAKTDGISLALLAASARGTDKPFVRGKAFAPADLKRRAGVIDHEFTGYGIIADFENGMAPTEVTAPDSVKKKMRVSIIDDPTAPTPGKVLKIAIPPGEYKGRAADQGYLRISVDIKDYMVAKDAGAIVSDIRMCLHGGKGFSHANDYIIESYDPAVKDPRFRSQRIFGTFGYAFVDGVWQRITLPFNLPHFKSNRMLKDVTDTRFRRVSFFFRKIDAPVEIYVDNIGNAKKGFSVAPPWSVKQESDPL